MYLDLPYDAEVTGIKVKQILGDAYFRVCISVPDNSNDEFKVWLNQRVNSFSQKGNDFYISYFASDGHTQFGEQSEDSSATFFTKIYWVVIVIVEILVFIPIEMIKKKGDFGNII